MRVIKGIVKHMSKGENILIWVMLITVTISAVLSIMNKSTRERPIVALAESFKKNGIQIHVYSIDMERWDKLTDTEKRNTVANAVKNHEDESSIWGIDKYGKGFMRTSFEDSIWIFDGGEQICLSDEGDSGR